MKKKILALVGLVSLMGMCACQGAESTGEAAAENVYTIEVHYTDENKDEIPEDVINSVMFLYAETVDATFTTTLTLDEENGTYVLTKMVDAGEQEENGETIHPFVGEWEFTGTYEGDGETIVLAAPEEGRTNIQYPTVLNYGSLEPQTQDWVDSTERPELLLRFNQWYPVVNEDVTDQTITLSSDGTMTFED